MRYLGCRRPILVWNICASSLRQIYRASGVHLYVIFQAFSIWVCICVFGRGSHRRRGEYTHTHTNIRGEGEREREEERRQGREEGAKERWVLVPCDAGVHTHSEILGIPYLISATGAQPGPPYKNRRHGSQNKTTTMTPISCCTDGFLLQAPRAEVLMLEYEERVH